MVKIRMDLVPCLLIGVLFFTLVTFAGNKYIEIANERWETQEIAEGEIGGVPSSDTPLVESIAEMKANDDFYVITEDTHFWMYYLFYEGKAWNGLVLPSGEVVCARINMDSCKDAGGYGKMQTPVGKIVPLELPDILISQLDEERDMTFSDTSFYVDMTGGRLEAPNEDDIKFKFNVASLIVFWAATIVSHMLGVKIGILPPIFPKRRKRE